MRTTLLLAPCLLALASLARAQEAPAVAPDRDLLTVLPADAYLVVATDRLDAIRERSAQNAWARFLIDDRVGADAAIGAVASESDEITRLSLAAWRGIQGEIVGFLAPPDASGGVLIRAGSGAAAVRALADHAIAEATADGQVVEDATHAGVALRVLRPKAGEGTAALFEIGDVFGFVVHEDGDAALALAHATIDRAIGPVPAESFATEPGFVSTRASGLPHPAVAAHLRVQEMMVAIDEDWSRDDWESEEDRRWVRALGLDRLRWAHLEADLGAGERLDFALRVHVPEATFLDRLTAAFGPLPIDMLGRLPGDATGVTLSGFDAPAIWTAIRGLVHDLGPEVEAEFEQGLADAETEIGTEVADLVAMLSGKVAGFQMRVPVEEVPELAMLGEPDPELAIGSAYLIGVPSADPLRDLVADLLAKSGMDGMVEQTTVAGYPTAVLSFGGMFEARWAFLDDAIAFGQQPTPFRTLLERTGTTEGSAAAHPAFAREARAYPEALYVAINDTATSVRTLLGVWQMLSMVFGMGMIETDAPFLTAPPDPSIADEFFRGTMTSAVRRRGDAFELIFATR